MLVLSRPAWRGLPVLVCLVAMLGCGGKDQAPADGGGQDQWLGCTASAQCTDGLFCNGEETCDPARLRPTRSAAWPAPPPANPPSATRRGACAPPPAPTRTATAIKTSPAVETTATTTTPRASRERRDLHADRPRPRRGLRRAHVREPGRGRGPLRRLPLLQRRGGSRVCGLDCDDTLPGVNPVVPEVCNTPMTTTATGWPRDLRLCPHGSTRPCGMAGPGSCTAGTQTCTAGAWRRARGRSRPPRTTSAMIRTRTATE